MVIDDRDGKAGEVEESESEPPQSGSSSGAPDARIRSLRLGTLVPGACGEGATNEDPLWLPDEL